MRGTNLETKPIVFRKIGDEFQLPDWPSPFLEKANKMYSFLNGPDDLVTKLNAIYRLMDEMAPFVASFTTCKKGCSHCCRYDVQITSFEAEYIFLKTGIPHRVDGPLTNGHNAPCPFLSNAGECGIYAHRPAVCRTYHALGDPSDCDDPDKDQLQYGSPAGDFGNQIYANLVGWIHFQTQHIGGRLRDIRDFFPHPREQVQKYLSSRV